MRWLQDPSHMFPTLSAEMKWTSTAQHRRYFSTQGRMDCSWESPHRDYFLSKDVQVAGQHPRKTMSNRLTKQMFPWVVSGPVPFSCIQNQEFLKLINTVDWAYKVPIRNTVQRPIVDEYELRREYMEWITAGLDGKFSLTGDAWSSRIMNGEMAITACQVDSNWNSHSIVLEFKRFPTRIRVPPQPLICLRFY